MNELKSSKQRNALQLAKAALSHRREDCWATGPATGDPIEDYIVCPGCRALNAIEAALQDETTCSDGYKDAFYQIAELLGMTAMPISPKEAFETAMLPRLRELLAVKTTPNTGEEK